MKTDLQLQKDVIAELSWEPSVEATQIGVEVKDGIVTLAGHVSSHTQKWKAEEAAQRVTGVKGVVVEVNVELPGLDTRPDVDIVKAANNALAWHVSLPRDAIKVTVDHGWIALSGQVEWGFQRSEAEAAVRNLIGIMGVENKIEIRPKIRPRDIKTKIEAALQRRAHLDVNAVGVKVEAGTVTLSGALDSWEACETVRLAAWQAPGVQNVVDRMRVAP